MNFPDAMARYRGEMIRNLESAERACEKQGNGGGPCIDKCSFMRNHTSVTCPLKKLREILGDHFPQQDLIRPLGLCPQGVPDGKEILCQASDFCEHQCWDPGTTYPIYCGQEGAILAFLEQSAEPFEETIWRALIATQQMAAGCPADCEENSCSCDKDPGEMPPECKENFMQSPEDDPESWR